MGLFSFVKNAGAKLLGVGQAKADSPATSLTAEGMKSMLSEHGLKVDGLDIVMEGDKAILSGSVATQEEAEKVILAIGNIEGVANVESKLTVTSPSTEAVFYTVKKGDTLWKIAEAHYGKGNGDKYTLIVKANTPPVKNPDLILPGWVLRIPPL